MRDARQFSVRGETAARRAVATVVLGMGAAVVAGVAVIGAGGGLVAGVGAYMLAGSGSVACVGLVQAARPLRPRFRRVAARLRQPAAILSH